MSLDLVLERWLSFLFQILFFSFHKALSAHINMITSCTKGSSDTATQYSQTKTPQHASTLTSNAYNRQTHRILQEVPPKTTCTIWVQRRQKDRTFKMATKNNNKITTTTTTVTTTTKHYIWLTVKLIVHSFMFWSLRVSVNEWHERTR